jgi:hypothetical protein
MSPPSPDRREPLPSLLELPVFLFRNLSPRGRRLAGVVGLALVLAIAAGLIFFARTRAAARASAPHGRTERGRPLRRPVARERTVRRAHGPPAGRPPPDCAARDCSEPARRSSPPWRPRCSRTPGRAGDEESCAGPPTGLPPAFAYPKSLDRRPPARNLAVRVARLECLAVTSVVAKERADHRLADRAAVSRAGRLLDRALRLVARSSSDPASSPWGARRPCESRGSAEELGDDPCSRPARSPPAAGRPQGGLALVQAFVNSHFDLEHRRGADRLASPGAAAAG